MTTLLRSFSNQTAMTALITCLKASKHNKQISLCCASSINSIKLSVYHSKIVLPLFPSGTWERGKGTMLPLNDKIGRAAQ
jgi:hypothetical protein